jgi:bleomycin hydrolase
LNKVFLSFFILLFVSCTHQTEPFTMQVLNSYTPVKDQGKGNSCWIYAMLAAIETEHIMRGDSVHLSTAYVEHFLRQDSLAPRSGRGMAITLIRMIERYGLVPYQAMQDSGVPAPRWAFMLGAEYTPLEFAHSVCAPGEYIALTTTASQPYYTSFILKEPDNWLGDAFLNLPPDSLLAVTRRSVAARHGVCWEGDTHRSGFDWEQGVARTTLLDDNRPPADAHCMAIVGLATDAGGHPFFVMKNSWGTGNDRDGLLFMSEDYFLHNTVAIVLPRSCLADTCLDSTTPHNAETIAQ